MRNLLDFALALESVRVAPEETTKSSPSFEEVMREIGGIVLVYLLLGLTAELLTRTLSQG